MLISNFLKRMLNYIKKFFNKENSIKALQAANINNVDNNENIKKFKEDLIVSEEKYLEIERKIKSNELNLKELSIDELKKISNIYDDAINRKKETVRELMNVYRSLTKKSV